MARRPTDGPTEAELEVLNVLWDRGPSTVSEVNETLNAVRPTGKTTTLKIMQIMLEKGILARDESVRPQVYRPRQSKEKTQAKLVRRLLRRAFDGSAAQLVLRALSDHNATGEELAEIRHMLDEMEDGGR
jgi:predicted transcriptional regulator